MKPEYRTLDPIGGADRSVETIASLVLTPTATNNRTWTIGELARECDVTLRALRFYEGKGLLAPAREGGARLYDAEDVRRLKLVLRLKDLGFSLVEIAGLIDRLLGGGDVGDGFAAVLTRVENQVDVLEQQHRDVLRALSLIEGEIAALRLHAGA